VSLSVCRLPAIFPIAGPPSVNADGMWRLHSADLSRHVADDARFGDDVDSGHEPAGRICRHV
jgi:hypothetical protein